MDRNSEQVPDFSLACGEMIQVVEKALRLGDFDTREQSEIREEGMEALTKLRAAYVEMESNHELLRQKLFAHGLELPKGVEA